MATNITNPSTGQTGYQVPGAAIPAGWVASPSQVSSAVNTAMGGSSSPAPSGGGYTPPTNPADIPGNPANKLVLPGLNAPTTPPTPQVNTAQPSPQTVNNTTGVNNPQTGNTQGAPLKPTDVAPQSLVNQVNQAAQQVDQLKQKYQQAHADLTASGVPSPSSSGAANAGVNTALNNQPKVDNTPTTTPAVDNYFNKDTNPSLDPNIQAMMDFLSPPAIQTDLANAMSKLTGDQNLLSQEKLQLMNMQNIMAGTPDDIRDEVTKANGFATESQVQAMAVARNKVLLKQSSQLQNQIQLQQDQVNTDTSLLNFEKDMANTQFTQRMSIMNYVQTNQNNMLNATRTSLNAIISQVGYDGLYKSLLNDPTQLARDEQILGLGAGGLQKLATTPQLGSYQVVKGGTDAFGNPLPDRIFNSKTGQFVGGSIGASPTTDVGVSAGGTNPAPILGSGGMGSGKNKLSFDQYGLLANTDFKPDNMVDGLAQKYLDQYIKNGTVPTASSLGRNMKPEAMAQVDSRARDLYFQATGQALPNPEIIKGYQQLINNNNQMANNLKIQERTVSQNVDFSLANMKKNDLNSSNFQPLNNLINTVGQMFSDPNIGQLIAQNTTIQNELGSLLAVKNASGTTVYDKLTSAGIIGRNDTPAVVTQKVNALMTEAANFADSISHANADIYKQIDPFLQDANNPLRNQVKVENALSSKNINYQDVIQKTPAGKIPVMDSSGNVGYIDPTEFNSSYIKL